MQAWLKANWHWLLVTLASIGIFGAIVTQKADNRFGTILFAPVFEQGGRWGLRFLLLSLAMSPFNALFGWRWTLKFRKPLGLAAFGFGMLHAGIYIRELSVQTDYPPVDPIAVLSTTYIFLGAVGLTILTLMALTSTNWAMRKLGKLWKSLHRWVYIAGVAVTVHALWAIANSKKAFLRGSWTVDELRFYVVAMLVLLVLRVPFIKNPLRTLIARGVKVVTGQATKRKRDTDSIENLDNMLEEGA